MEKFFCIWSSILDTVGDSDDPICGGRIIRAKSEEEARDKYMDEEWDDDLKEHVNDTEELYAPAFMYDTVEDLIYGEDELIENRTYMKIANDIFKDIQDYLSGNETESCPEMVTEEEEKAAINKYVPAHDCIKAFRSLTDDEKKLLYKRHFRYKIQLFEAE